MNPNNNEDNNTNVIDKENLSPTPTATHNKQHNLSQFLVDSCPLASTRDPRRKELLNRLPFSPNNEQTFSSDDKKKDPNRNGKRRVLTPAYAYKNAKTGLLEISTIHPPSPSVVAREEAEEAEDEVIKNDLAEENDQNENQNCQALLPALYPIALNGGGCGIYTHPSDFGSNTRTPLTTIGESNSNSHQSIEKEVEGMIQDMRSNHTTYHNNTNLQKLGNRRAPLSSYVAFQEYQNEDESSNYQRIRGDQDHTLLSSVDQHKAHDLETGTLKEHQKPWKIWEKIHMDMSRRTPPSSLLSSSSPQKSHQKKKKQMMMTMQSPLSTNAVVPDDISANASDCEDDDLPKVPPTSNHHHVGRISSVYNDDDFDFALVLTSQRVYEFWANHLDFRGEHYSHDDQGHDEIDCNDYFQPIYHKNTPSSFISPQPTTTIRISQRRLTATNVIMTDEKSSEMMNCTPSYYNTPTPIRFQQQQRNVDEYGRRTFTRRKSLFERALERLTPPSAKQKGQTQQYMMGSPTPTTSTRKTSIIMHPPRSRMRSILKGNTPIEQQQQQQQHQSNTSLIISSSSKKKKLKRGKGMENSVFLGSTTPMTNNHHNSSNNTNTNTGVSANKQLVSSSSDKRNNRNKQGLITNDTNNEEKDDEIFFPSQVIPRGIAARNNGMQEFLQALHRGIVVKRHVSNGEAEFVKLSSSDGGDNITYHYIPPEEALPALKEQRVRFNNRGNKKFKSKQDTTIHDNRWYHSFHNQNNHNNHTNIHNGHGNTLTSHDTTTNNNNIPNAVVAQNQAKITSGRIFSAISDYSTKFIHSGKAHARDIIAVHPARHVDPFSARKYAENNNDTEDDEGDEENIQFGTASLRNSHSPYSVDCTFSLILPQKKVKGAIYGALDTLERGIQTATGRNHDINQNEETTGWTNIEKWYSGQGSMTSFRTLDFECATQGEYWVIFRGFLLLHRDAASGRFATQRASGFSSHYSRKEEDARQRTDKNDPSSPNFVWPEEEYERNYRKKKASDFQNVKTPPSDYFLGFKSRGTQIWSRLRQAGLETQRVYSLDTKRVMIKLRCPAERLQDVAEVLNIKLKSANGKEEGKRKFAYLTMFSPVLQSL